MTSTINHESVRAALVDLPRLVEVADRARYFTGEPACAEGECEHVDRVDEPCALLVPAYATAEHIEQLDAARRHLRTVYSLAHNGSLADPAGMLQAFAAILDECEAAGVGDDDD